MPPVPRAPRYAPLIRSTHQRMSFSVNQTAYVSTPTRRSVKPHRVRRTSGGFGWCHRLVACNPVEPRGTWQNPAQSELNGVADGPAYTVWTTVDVPPQRLSTLLSRMLNYIWF